MIVRSTRSVVCACLVALLFSAVPATAQITTGTVLGTVKDSTGGVVPGATVVLVSETRGTKSVPAVTNATGDYVFPNITADTYTVEVTMDGFRTVKRDRHQGQRRRPRGGSGTDARTGRRCRNRQRHLRSAAHPGVERRAVVRGLDRADREPAGQPPRDGFTSFTSFTPGVIAGGASAGGTRLGGVGQNNIMMDGISAMDTGNNGQMLNMNVESIAEVKVLTQGYQAEYGRSSGLQITAVTKSGTNRFRGSRLRLQDQLGLEREQLGERRRTATRSRSTSATSTATRSAVRSASRAATTSCSSSTRTSTGRPTRPSTAATRSGSACRPRSSAPGDFSQTRDNNGALFNIIRDHHDRPALLRRPTRAAASRTAASSAGFRRAGSISTGVALLNRYPMPNVAQAAGTNYNYQVARAGGGEPRRSSRPSGWTTSCRRSCASPASTPASARAPLIDARPDPGLHRRPQPEPVHHQLRDHRQLRDQPDDLHRRHVRLHPQRAGRRQRGRRPRQRVGEPADLDARTSRCSIRTPATSTRATTRTKCSNDVNPAFWDGSSINLPPVFSWGGRIGAAPPNQRYPGWLNINRTQDVAISLTKIAGRHTFKGGFYNNHSFKAQNVGAGGVANLSFQGTVNFGNDTNNPLDTGFGYANAATGIFTPVPAGVEVHRRQHDLQQHRVLHPGQLEGEQPADPRLRHALHAPAAAARPVPADVELLPRSVVSASQAPVLYVAGCSNGAVTCSGNTRNAMDPRTGQILTSRGVANTPVRHRHADSRHGQPAQRHPPGGRRHLEVRLHVADAGRSVRVSARPTT